MEIPELLPKHCGTQQIGGDFLAFSDSGQYFAAASKYREIVLFNLKNQSNNIIWREDITKNVNEEIIGIKFIGNFLELLTRIYDIDSKSVLLQKYKYDIDKKQKIQFASLRIDNFQGS